MNTSAVRRGGWIRVLRGISLESLALRTWPWCLARAQILALGVAILLSVAALVHIGSLAKGWNPALSNDTQVFFYPALRVLNEDSSLKTLLDPFLTAPLERPPNSDEVKPLLVSTQRAWSLLFEFLNPAYVHPSHHVMSYYVTFSLVLALLACVFWGWSLNAPWVGVGTGVIALLNSWMIPNAYFSTYNGGSLVLAILSYAFLYSRLRYPWVAGALMTLTLFYNQSLIVCFPALLVPLVFHEGSWRSRLRIAGLYFGGAVLTWLAFEAVVGIAMVVTGQTFLFRFQLLASYLGRSLNDASDYFWIYRGFFAPNLFWNYSPAVSLVFVVALGSSVWRWIRGGRERVSLQLGIFIIAWLAFIELRNGPKFSRTYSLLLPFVVFFMLWEVRIYWQRVRGWPGWVKMSFLGVLALTYVMPERRDLLDMERAFLGFRNAIIKSEHVFYFFSTDTYTTIFRILLEEQSNPPKTFRMVSSPCDISGREAFIAMPPSRGKSLFNAAQKVDPVIDLTHDRASGTCGMRKWTARLVKRYPFFTHYPFFVLEDMIESEAMLKSKAYDWNAYLVGEGQASIWEIAFEESPESL